jgi:hypothetical protein
MIVNVVCRELCIQLELLVRQFVVRPHPIRFEMRDLEVEDCFYLGQLFSGVYIFSKNTKLIRSVLFKKNKLIRKNQ